MVVAGIATVVVVVVGAVVGIGAVGAATGSAGVVGVGAGVVGVVGCAGVVTGTESFGVGSWACRLAVPAKANSAAAAAAPMSVLRDDIRLTPAAAG